MKRSRKKQVGSVLLLAIFFLMVLFFLAMALLELLPLELHAAGRQRLETAAFLAADSGILHALTFMEDRVGKGETPLPGDAASHALEGGAGEWTWQATVKADPETPPNGTNTVRVYEILSVASLDGIPYRAVRAVARQESFAKFSWFEDQRDPSLVISTGHWHFDGPFHSNSKIKVWIGDGFYQSQTPPLFGGEVSTVEAYSSPDGVYYDGTPPYDAGGNPIPERYRKIYRGGRESLQTGAKRIELPADSGTLLQAALGPGGVTATAAGVQVGLASTSEGVDGGIAIGGDVEAMTLAVEPGENRSVSIKQGGATTKVLEVTDTSITDPDGHPVPVGSTVVYRPDSSFSVHTGLTNGLVYCTGSIKSLQGVNKGKRTVAVDLAAGKEIVVGGPLTRADTPVGQKPAGGRDTLGLVAYKVRVPVTVARTVTPPLDVYAVILAGSKGTQGGLYIDNWESRPQGMVRLFGGLIQAYKPAWAHVGSSGVTMESHYDPNLATSPPPYFPTIGKFRVVRYQEEAPDQG